MYFDSTPRRHPEAYGRLTELGDDSSNYLWKVAAAREIMRLYRDDRDELTRLAALHEAKGSAEEVLHPPAETTAFVSGEDLRRAWNSGDIVPFPTATAVTGLRRDRRMGELARRVGQPAQLYRGLRPEALAMALYIGAQVRDLGGASPLVVTSTVRDGDYQDELAGRNGEATRNFSLHTTGYAFDVLREYRSRRQALAFQFVLDRLRTLNAIAWVREPAAIHITAGPDADALLPLLERVGIEPSSTIALGGGRAGGRAGLVGRARAAIGVPQRLLDADQRAPRPRGRAAAGCPANATSAPIRARHVDVEARALQRGEHLARHVLRLDRLHARLGQPGGQLRAHDAGHHDGDLDAAAAQLGPDRLARARRRRAWWRCRSRGSGSRCGRRSTPCSRCGRCGAATSGGSPPACRG